LALYHTHPWDWAKNVAAKRKIKAKKATMKEKDKNAKTSWDRN